MSITIDRSNENDRPAILWLMNEARGDDLSEDERAKQGFVQGQMDESLLSRFQFGSGVFVARDGTTLAGFCMTSTSALALAAGGPSAEMVKAIAKKMPEMPLDQIFLNGPVAVDRRYKGKGLLTRLLVHVCNELRTQFKLGVLFVEYANSKSLAIHRHYPMDESTTFTFNGRSYAVFTFAPDNVINHYR